MCVYVSFGRGRTVYLAHRRLFRVYFRVTVVAAAVSSSPPSSSFSSSTPALLSLFCVLPLRGKSFSSWLPKVPLECVTLNWKENSVKVQLVVHEREKRKAKEDATFFLFRRREKEKEREREIKIGGGCLICYF